MLWYIIFAFFIGVLIHSLIIKFSHKKKLFLDAQLKVQRVHKKPIPRIGGLGIFFSALLMIIDRDLGIFMILSSIPVFIAGFIEDFTESIQPLPRLAIMSIGPAVLFALVLATGGIELWISLQGLIGLFIAYFIFTIAIINGVNFIDGANGLAAGTTLISTLTIAFLSFKIGDQSLLYLTLILSTAIFAFLIFNYPKAKIFLGDSGSYTLGFMLAGLSMLLVLRHINKVHWLFLGIVLLYPMLEVGFSVFRKLLFDKISPLDSDRNHLHQIIIRNHGKDKNYLALLYILPFQIAAIGLGILFLDQALYLLMIILIFGAIYLLYYIRSRRKMYQNSIISKKK